MFQQSYPIAGPDLILNFEHGGGDLHLHGSDESYLRIQGEGEPNDYKAQWQNGVLTMRLHEDCVFFVPRKLNLRVSGRFGDLDVNELAGNLVISGGNDVMINTATGNVEIGSVSGDLKATELGALKVSDRIAGDAIIASVAGAVQLETVSGDLIVNDAQSLSVAQDIHGSAKISNVGSPVQLGEVMGDLTVRDIHGGVTAREVKGSLKAVDIDGDLTIAEVAGEAKIHSVAGSVVIHNVAGDARLEDIEGFVHSFEAGGDLHITPNLTGGEAYEFKAGGDLVILIDESTPAKFQCAAGGEVISRLSGYAVRKAGSWTHEIGEGGPTVRLEAGGDVKIKPQEEGNVEFRVEINQEEM
ncbi:MAG: hypothetical protein HY259_09615, partial [Chloroflexi bacterium]|nr:hypothetical protein [Chloroflexota bacterium]